ncbi:MAG: hypothetical protein AB4372_15770 [Xenococcus sp. (in: cyanobacteria)]
MSSKTVFSKEGILAIVMLITVMGSLYLAIIDTNSRPQFIDLTKFAVGTYLGLLIPRASNSN